ncbi:MAG: sulfur carrier protein ThiS [Lachnospiraceae bacterium]|nr:sulfur carrier protein ThiS [Lachnospiraceae bacterium]
MKVNGEEKNLTGISVKKMLVELNFDETKVVVERNMEIVPKSAYETTFISEADELEVVSFVGGG